MIQYSTYSSDFTVNYYGNTYLYQERGTEKCNRSSIITAKKSFTYIKFPVIILFVSITYAWHKYTVLYLYLSINVSMHTLFCLIYEQTLKIWLIDIEMSTKYWPVRD